MKIVRLQSENIKRLHAVEVTPEGTITTIGGKNDAGKSSVLDSIAYALGGAAMLPVDPIRLGETHAQIVVELDDLIVTRRFKRERAACNCTEKEVIGWSEYANATDKTGKVPDHLPDCPSLTLFGPTSSSLTVTNKDKAKYPSPQAVLDKIYGKLTFDPLAFVQDKDQAATLRRLVGLDTTAVDARRKEAFDRRAMLKKTYAIKHAQLLNMPSHKDVPETEISVAALVDELTAANTAAEEAADLRKQAIDFADEITKLEQEQKSTLDDIADLERQLAFKRDRLKAISGNIMAAQDALAVKQNAASAAEGAVPDRAAISARIAESETTNKRVRENAAYRAATVEAEKVGIEVEEADAEVAAADRDKAEMLAAAVFPVPGLGLDDNLGVTYNGTPLSQAGTATQMRVSVAIGIALNPTLKVLLIRNGNLLDDDALKAVAAQAEESGTQIWMEYIAVPHCAKHKAYTETCIDCAARKDSVSVMLVEGEML